MIINMIQESCIHLFLTNRLINYQMFQKKKNFYSKSFYQNSRELEVEDKINITLVINSTVTYKK